jgi:hypothetical protein
LEAQYSKNLKEFRETELKQALEEHERNLLDTVQELETKYERKLKEQEDEHHAQVFAYSHFLQRDLPLTFKQLLS